MRKIQLDWQTVMQFSLIKDLPENEPIFVKEKYTTLR